MSSEGEPVVQVDLIGLPFSTFTRTIRLGLEEKRVPYNLVLAPPHAKQATEHHPFGLIPSLVFRHNNEEHSLIESVAIANFIDAFWPTVPLRPSRTSTDLKEIYTNVRIDELNAIVAHYLFRDVQPNVVKARLRHEKEKKSEEEIQTSLRESLNKLHETLGKLEQRSLLPTQQAFLAGAQVTWADFFVYPLLADLRAVREGDCVRGEKALFPHLSAWMDRMEKLDSVQKTIADTLQDGWRPPSLRV